MTGNSDPGELKTETTTTHEKSIDDSGTAENGHRISSFNQKPDDVPARVWAKLDLIVLPLVTMMYFLSSLDRTNIGNARIAGLQRDLNLSNSQYSTALTIALVPYVLVEVPFNYVMIRVGPRVLMPTLVCLWGMTCALQGVVHNYSGLLACRFFLGLFEGGLPPGVFFYLASFYPRHMLQLRMSIMFSSSAFAGAFSGLLAAGIINMDGVGGRPGWAWIFILEGSFSVLFGLVAFTLLPNSPDAAFTLKKEEKELVTRALLGDGIVQMKEHANRRSWIEFKHAFAQPHVIMVTTGAFFSGVTLSSLAYYLPSIVSSLGFAGTRAQLMSVPPFAVSGVLSIATAILADRFAHRGLTVMFFAVLSTAGFALFLASFTNHVRYGSLFLAVPGTYAVVAPLTAWTANNTSPLPRRATSIAFLTSMANAGAILSTWLFGSLSPAPRYTSATITLLVLQVGILTCAVCTAAYLWRENARKAKLRMMEKSRRGDTPVSSTVELPNESIWFEYVM